MSRSQDQKFFDLFSAILAALVLFTLAMIALSIGISNRTIAESNKVDPQMQGAAVARIAPIGKVQIAGVESEAPDALLAAVLKPQPEPEPAAAVVVSSEPRSGEQVYNLACIACHGAGIAGAPAVGDAQAWAPRIAQGMEVLSDHAINGYTGSMGMMPARGGNSSLSDEEVNASITYMVDRSR